MQNAHIGLVIIGLIIAFGLALFYFDHLREPRKPSPAEDEAT
ncbi:hypothetical protein thsps21_36560 [Pseudomonas sp. No.21]|nr:MULTISPECIES: hypothetical protein [Pseudomonas]MDW3713341.1 hypothetical protein [Pseudomonas sp. 2023EL-01195]GJN45663.1 hypothetical protein TUM20249_16490 [Pseudomonas tohonis]